MILVNAFMKRMIKTLMFNTLNICNLWKSVTVFKGQSQILMYHRISELEDIPGISGKAFESHLKFLKKNYKIVPVSEIIDDRERKKTVRGKVAITFDDGYEDFYQKAWPLISKFKIPVTLYVATGFLDKKIWFWPDKIRMILKETTLSEVDIKGIGKVFINAKEYQQNWNNIADYCLRMGPQEREAFLTHLASLFKVVIKEQPSECFSSVSWDQLKAMHLEGLNVGSHTISHPLLTCIDDEQLLHELHGSKRILEDRLQASIKGICYPNGTKRDISSYVIEVAKSVNYEYGLVAYNSESESFNRFKSQRLAASESLSELAFDLLNK